MQMITPIAGVVLVAALKSTLVIGHVLPDVALSAGQQIPGAGLSSSNPGLPVGYTLQEAEFAGNILGEDFKLNGTIQEVLAQLQHQHKDVDLSNSDILGVGGSNFFSQGLRPRVVLKRAKILPPLCIPVAGQPWNHAYGYATDKNIKRLEKLGGVIGVNKKSCVRIACSDASAILLCNDNDFKITPNTVYISTYANDLRNKCDLRPPMTNFDLVGEQEFDTDNYNVIVSDSTCF